MTTEPEIRSGTVDIVLPCHDSDPAMLAQSIASVVSQTFRDWTLTVVDDGNDSGFQSLVESAARGDSRVRILANGRNMGLPVSLERGCLCGEGEFVGFTSDDNWYASSFMEETVALMRRDCLGLCRCMEIHVEPSGASRPFDPRYGSSCLPRFRHDGYLGAGHLFRRDAYRMAIIRFGAGWDPELHGIEDLDMYYKLVEVGAKVGFLDRPLYYYREGTSGFAGSTVLAARERFMRKWGI